eukprot:g13607.t1
MSGGGILLEVAEMASDDLLNVDAGGIPFSQFLRLRRICSNDTNFEKRASEMSTFFLNRGFPSSVVDRVLNQVQPISYTSALTPSLPSYNSDRAPLILTYHPTSIHIQKII